MQHFAVFSPFPTNSPISASATSIGGALKGGQIGSAVGAGLGIAKGSGAFESEEERAKTNGWDRAAKMLGYGVAGTAIGGGIGSAVGYKQRPLEKISIKEQTNLKPPFQSHSPEKEGFIPPLPTNLKPVKPKVKRTNGNVKADPELMKYLNNEGGMQPVKADEALMKQLDNDMLERKRMDSNYKQMQHFTHFAATRSSGANFSLTNLGAVGAIQGAKTGLGAGALYGLARGMGAGETQEEKDSTTALGRVGKILGRTAIGSVAGAGIGTVAGGTAAVGYGQLRRKNQGFDKWADKAGLTSEKNWDDRIAAVRAKRNPPT